MFAGIMRWAALFCASLFVMAAGPAAARGVFQPDSTCLAEDPRREGFAALASQPDKWTCDEDSWSIRSERVVLRFDLRGTGAQEGAAFATRLTQFAFLRITAIGVDGGKATKVLSPDEMDRSSHDWLMSTTLPRLGERPRMIYVEIAKPRHLGMLTDASVGPSPDRQPHAMRVELLLAAMCGLLIIPFIYNVAFYRVLRERFLLWHAVAVAFMLTHTLVSSGLINHFVTLTVDQLSFLSATTWSGGIIAAGTFIVNLVEPGRIDPAQQRIARLLAPWVVFWTAFYLFADGPLRAFAAPAYYGSFLPVLALFAWIMTVALRRRSRAIMFQIAAWSPIMLVGAARIISMTGLMGTPLELMLAQHFAITIEVIITSLGVADRFMTIKRQRDRALAETRSLEDKVERDALTGLLNRRAIGDRFAELHELGFDTMAVIDLDHFKRVNDNHGHAAGDEVLRSIARALMPDEDTLAVRMGGEEFLLLMRGPDSAERAERRRKAITARIAADVPGLDRPVTASMGLVEQPVGARIRADFVSLYAHCDRLLYEAKRAGRNRTMSERVTHFERRQAHPDRAAG